MLHSHDSLRFSESKRHIRSPESPQQPRRFSATSASSVDMPWQQGRVPNGYWDVRENRLMYLTWLGSRYGFLCPTDWYDARKAHFQKNGGGGLLRNEYRSSVLRAMRDFRPDYDWKPWLFGGAPRGFWKLRQNRCRYLDWLATQLQVVAVEDWYNVTGADFFSHHGGGLLNNEYRGSVQALLSDYRPDYPWKAWCFTSVPQSFWATVQNRRAYLRWLGDRLGFHGRKDWQALRREHFYENHGSGVFVGYYGGSRDRAIEELFATDTAPDSLGTVTGNGLSIPAENPAA